MVLGDSAGNTRRYTLLVVVPLAGWPDLGINIINVKPGHHLDAYRAVQTLLLFLSRNLSL